MSVCLFVYLVNLKTAEPIGSEFDVATDINPGKVIGWLKMTTFGRKKFRHSLVIKNTEKMAARRAKLFTAKTGKRLKG